MAVYRGELDENGNPVIEFEGKVLDRREKNGYDDSDFEALVETDAGDFVWIMYASTRFSTYDNYAVIDATPDVKARYEAHRLSTQKKMKAIKEDVAAHMPDVGRLAILTHDVRQKGETYPKGTFGIISWVGRDRYEGNRWIAENSQMRRAYGVHSIELDCRDINTRVGITLDDGRRVFVNATKVDVIAEFEEDMDVE